MSKRKQERTATSESDKMTPSEDTRAHAEIVASLTKTVKRINAMQARGEPVGPLLVLRDMLAEGLERYHRRERYHRKKASRSTSKKG